MNQDEIPTQYCITKIAYNQYLLISQNDYTVKDKDLRIDISGKGCSGFDYSLSFQTTLEEDILSKFFLIDQQNIEQENIAPNKYVNVYLSKFCFEYLKYGIIDYIFNPQENIDAFSVTNLNEKNFKGKFWKNQLN